MLNQIECCNRKIQGNIFCIGNNIYLVCSKCPNCGTYIAEVRKRTDVGVFKTTIRRRGESANRLYEKHKKMILDFDYYLHKGSRAEEYNFYTKFGIIYNGNGARISAHDDFLKMTREEINAILNKRFYKSR